MSNSVNAAAEAGRLILDTADRLLREQCSKELVDAAEAGTWPDSLWRTLMETGLPWAAAPERLGGAGLDLPDALGLLRLVGSHAAPVPLAETLVATALLGEDAAVTTLPAGPISIALPSADSTFEARRTGEGWRLDGSIADVHFANVAEVILVVVASPDGLVLLRVKPADVAMNAGRNLAGEPVADLDFAGIDISAEQATGVRSLQTLEQFLALMALTRALMSAGGMQSLLDLSVGYALERKQFGRPIAQFQAVQQQLAVLAGEAAAAIRAADAGLEALADAFAEDGDAGRLEAAVRAAGVAKSRAGEAAGRGAEIAHQVHGAMGFTYEHRLHHRTRRLWAWRDQYGSETYWQSRFGRQLCAAGADALWDELTRPH